MAPGQGQPPEDNIFIDIPIVVHDHPWSAFEVVSLR